MAFAMFLSFFIAKGEDLDTAQSKETKHSGVNNVVTNKFKDNWFISLGLGGDVYMGQNDKAMPFGDRIGFTGHISGGKWIVGFSGDTARSGAPERREGTGADGPEIF